MPKLKGNNVTFPKHKYYQDILNFIDENYNYYNHKELIELIYWKFGYIFYDVRILKHNLKIRGIKKPISTKFKTVHIESIYRFIPSIQKQLDAKQKKEKKEEKYEEQIRTKLERIKNIGKEIKGN